MCDFALSLMLFSSSNLLCKLFIFKWIRRTSPGFSFLLRMNWLNSELSSSLSISRGLFVEVQVSQFVETVKLCSE